MPVFVGLDCGGSSCRVVAADEHGTVLFQGQGGSANLASTPERLISTNLRRASQGVPNADAVCGCFAGLLTEEDRERALIHLRHTFPGAELRAEPDYAAALFANEPTPDLCVICGTGSLVCSAKNGGIVKSGGGGYILGDFGSAFQFGRDSLSHYLFGAEPPTERLSKAVIDLFETDVPNAVIARVYKSASPPALVAKLAKTLGHEASEGVPYAVESLKRNMSLLAGLAARHVRTHIAPRVNGFEGLAVVLSGGIWKDGMVFRNAFETHLKRALDLENVTFIPTRQPPVRGAVKLAMEIARGN